MSSELTRELVDDANRRVSKLFECWNHRLILSEANLRERYVERGTDLHLHISHDGNDACDFCAVFGFAGDGVRGVEIDTGHEQVREPDCRDSHTRLGMTTKGS